MISDSLKNRSLVRIAGNDAEHFLENLITCDVANLNTGHARFGALLTPQGKIMYDFFLFRGEDGYRIDIASASVQEFVKRLMFYRLRAKVDIEIAGDVTVELTDEAPRAQFDFTFQDPRHPGMGDRTYGLARNSGQSGEYDARRVALNIPEGGMDFEYGSAYPHETLMDQFSGVDFKKGCYVGQEVVSRMQHRGTAKKRVIQITADTELPETGTQISADGKPAGNVGTVAGSTGLALLRLDRIAKAQTVLAGEIKISAKIPDWVSFGWPGDD